MTTSKSLATTIFVMACGVAPGALWALSVILLGSLASLAAGLMTVAGAIPAFFGREISPRAADTLLGFAAGVMLAASFLSLIIPAVEAGERLYGGRVTQRRRSPLLASSLEC